MSIMLIKAKSYIISLLAKNVLQDESLKYSSVFCTIGYKHYTIFWDKSMYDFINHKKL